MFHLSRDVQRNIAKLWKPLATEWLAFPFVFTSFPAAKAPLDTTKSVEKPQTARHFPSLYGCSTFVWTVSVRRKFSRKKLNLNFFFSWNRPMLRQWRSAVRLVRNELNLNLIHLKFDEFVWNLIFEFFEFIFFWIFTFFIFQFFKTFLIFLNSNLIHLKF